MMELERTNQMTAMGRTAALHIAFWQYDPWYRRAWFVWPQVTAILLASWLLVRLVGPEVAVSPGNWAKPADCSNALTPGCAATRRAVLTWDDEVSRPSIANQITVNVDRSAFRNSTADDQPKLNAALGAYYRFDWARAVDILRSATASDPNVQFVTALALLVPNSTDQARDAEPLLREAAAGGIRQAGSVLGRILFAGTGGLPKDEVAGRKLIDDAVAAGEPYAMRLAAAGYVSGEFGAYDTVKAVDLLRRAADSGELVAMAQFAYCINTGRGGLSRDNAKAIDYLQRSADAGFEGAQFTLARWFRDRYGFRESGGDLPESIKWFERAYRQGHSVFALAELAYVHRYAREVPLFDTKRSFELFQLCAPYRNAYCHYWLARAYHDGAGTARDYNQAYAHYTVAKELGWRDTGNNLQKLDDFLQPAIKTSAAELAKTILAGLKPVPRVIMLETAETESAGTSSWPDLPPRPASP